MLRQFVYGLAVFLSSACGLIIEIVAGRLIAPYVGMSLYTWTAIIAVVLAGFSAGNWIGGLLAGPRVDATKGARRAAAALGLAAVSSLASLALLRVVSNLLLGGGFGPIPSIILLTSSAFLLPSLFVGIVAPILTKLAVDAEAESTAKSPGRVIGRMYALGALGGIAGTLAAGYLFISWIGSSATVVSVAAVYAFLALGLAIADPLRLGLLVLLAAGGGGLGWWSEQVRAFESPCQVESDYFCIRIVDFSPESGRQSRMMVLDHLVHGINDRDNPGLLYSPYIHAVDEIAKLRFGGQRAPSAYFIGGGGYSLPRAWASDYAGRKPGGQLMVAEIDPAVTKAARDHMWLPARVPGLAIHHRDGREFLQSLPAAPAFDVIFGDAFRDISIPAHLVTREFHGEIARRLTRRGFYAVKVVDNGNRRRFLFSLLRTLKKDFPAVEVWLEADGAGAAGRVTFVVVASALPTPAAEISSARGIPRTWVRWPASDLAGRVSGANPPILTDDFAPVDRLMAPLLPRVRPGTLSWRRQPGSRPGGW